MKLNHIWININNHKKSDTWKIQLAIPINFVSSEDTDEGHVMHSKSDNIEIPFQTSLGTRH